jgi:Xaa-Pro aminopeptidase
MNSRSSSSEGRVPAPLVEACAARLARLREALAVDALLVTHDKDIRYLTRFVGHDSVLLVTGDAALIISDCRYDEALDPWKGIGLVEIVMGTQHRLPEAVATLAGSSGISRLGLQAEHVTIASRRTLAESLPGVTLVDTEGLVGTLRIRKDDLEVATIERAIDIHQQAITATLPQIAVGMTELEVCAILEHEMKARGASGPSFDTMVRTGPGSSVIHAITGGTRIEDGHVLLMDWGAIVDGYCSDTTRTFGVGSMPAPMRELYLIVFDAQAAAIEACAPGRTCAEVDSVARSLITAAGYGDQFGHGLGHGLGLDIHEDPYFNQLSTDTILEPGMVMTVEPGIYLPGVGGVRIEDDVLITETGYRVLTDYPKGLDDSIFEPSGTVVQGTPA